MQLTTIKQKIRSIAFVSSSFSLFIIYKLSSININIDNNIFIKKFSNKFLGKYY